MTPSRTVSDALRGLVPAPARREIGRRARAFALGRALARIDREGARAVQSGRVLDDLAFGWGNASWAASTPYLRRMAEALADLPGACVLECGSGLSSLVLGAIARRSGARVWSLEHSAAWRAHVADALTRHRIESVRVCEAPLREYDGFDWYAPPAEVRAQRFDLVVCDGPPSTTRGGRYGLMPVLGECLAPGALVLLDDAARDGERDALARWQVEFGGRVAVQDVGRPYAEYWPGESAQPPGVASRAPTTPDRGRP